MNSDRGGPTQLINNNAAVVSMDSEVLNDVMISFIALKFRSHSLIEIGIVAMALKSGFNLFGTTPGPKCTLKILKFSSISCSFKRNCWYTF